MSEVLSQSEIDALLFAVSSGSVDTAPQPADSNNDWIAYDLASQEKIYQGKFAGLTGIHERFARLFRISLTNAFKKKVSVTVTNTDHLKFGDYTGSMVLPVSLNLLFLPKLHGNMVLMVTSKLLYALVDAYYGGIERPFAKLGSREEFTTIEKNVVRKVCALAINDLKEAWRLNYPLEIDYVKMESNPSFIGAIHSSDLVSVVSFEVEFDNLSGPFNLIIQLGRLDPIQSMLSVNVTSEFDTEAAQWRAHWLREIAATPLDVRVELGQSEKSLKEVQGWKVGDVIVLNQNSTSPVKVLLEELPKLQGLMGSYHGNIAIRLQEG